MNILLIASGPSDDVNQVVNRLLSCGSLYFSTPAQISILEDCLRGLEGHVWREFSGGEFGANKILLDVLNDDVRIDSVVLLPHFSEDVPFDMLSVMNYSEAFKHNTLSFTHALMFLAEHDRLKAGAHIAIINPAIKYSVNRIPTFSSLRALAGVLTDLYQTSDIFSTVVKRVFSPPPRRTPHSEEDYIEGLVKFVQKKEVLV